MALRPGSVPHRAGPLRAPRCRRHPLLRPRMVQRGAPLRRSHLLLRLHQRGEPPRGRKRRLRSLARDLRSPHTRRQADRRGPELIRRRRLPFGPNLPCGATDPERGGPRGGRSGRRASTQRAGRQSGARGRAGARQGVRRARSGRGRRPRELREGPETQGPPRRSVVDLHRADPRRSKRGLAGEPANRLRREPRTAVRRATTRMQAGLG